MAGWEGTQTTVAIIVAATGTGHDVCASVEGFAAELGNRGEIILVDATEHGVCLPSAASIRVLCRERSMLVPELWREGILATSADFIAFTTAQMVPGQGWLDSLLAVILHGDVAAVGGPIVPSDRLGLLDRAVYLQRYAQYGLPRNASAPSALPGENAIYRRSALDESTGDWSSGFWEFEVLRGMQCRGALTAQTDRAPVTFIGGASLGAILRQRFLHSRRFGADRASRMSTAECLARTALSPVVPLVMLVRSGATVAKRRERLTWWVQALPHLMFILAAWTLGEIVGIWLGVESRRRAVGELRKARPVRIEGRP